MVSTYTGLGTEQIATGEKINTWGDALNNSVFALLVEAVSNVAIIPVTTDAVLTAPNGVSAVVRSALMKFTDAGMAGPVTITVPAAEKLWWVHYTGLTHNLILTCGGTPATIRPNSFTLVYCDGINVINTELPLDRIKPAQSDVNLNNQKLLNVAAGVDPSDGANLQQVIEIAGADQSDLAAQYAALAMAWAANPEDVAVTGGLYSARHYAIKALASALAAQTWDPTSYYTKTATDALIAANVPRIPRAARTSNSQIVVGDVAKLFDITAGTFAQTFASVATFANGWFCYIRNSGTGEITLDPSGTETIDGLASYIMYPGETRLVLCDGAAFRTVVITSFVKAFTASGNYVHPPGYAGVSVDAIDGGGGGASGARGRGTQSGADGGVGGSPGARKMSSAPVLLVPGQTYVATVGSGGVGGQAPTSTLETVASVIGSAGGVSSLSNVVLRENVEGVGGAGGAGGKLGSEGAFLTPAAAGNFGSIDGLPATTTASAGADGGGNGGSSTQRGGGGGGGGGARSTDGTPGTGGTGGVGSGGGGGGGKIAASGVSARAGHGGAGGRGELSIRGAV